MKKSLVNPPLGVQFDQQTCRVINRTGSATVVGEVVAFDLTSSITEVTTNGTGETGMFANVITPVTGQLRAGLFGICKEIAADNAEMEIVLQGRVEALVGDSPALGALLIAQNGEVDLTDTAGAAGQKILGIALETTSTNPDLIWVLFDGISNSFGASDDQ